MINRNLTSLIDNDDLETKYMTNDIRRMEKVTDFALANVIGLLDKECFQEDDHTPTEIKNNNVPKQGFIQNSLEQYYDVIRKTNSRHRVDDTLDEYTKKMVFMKVVEGM